MRLRPASSVSLLLTLLALLLSGSGCEGEFLGFRLNTQSKYAIVFIDASSSIRPEDRNVYQASFDSLLQSLVPGDRVEVAVISDHTLTQYVPLADETIANTGVKLADDREAKAAKERLTEALHATFQRRSPATRVLDALAIARQRFAADDIDARPLRWLVLLSDMLEESDELNLARRNFSPQESENFIKARKDKGRIPNLSGVEIFVGGATAANVKTFESAQQFWTTYFMATGASFPAKNYQRAAVRFH